MAQSELTVTPPSPSPPTNMSCTGATPPNVPNLTKATYTDWLDNTKFDTAAPPYFDDGTAGALITFAANTAALASGTGATSGGTENSYPGTGTGTTVNNIGAVPASTSVAHEGAGTETVYTAPGSLAYAPTQSVSCLGAYTISPNEAHKSSMSVAPAAAPTITGLLPVAPVSAGGGTTPLTVNGTNFRQNSVVNIAGVPQQTQFNSVTQLKVINAPKRATAGNLAVTVTTGSTTTAPTNWVFT